MTSKPCGRLSSKPTARTSTYEESSPDGEPAPCATRPTSDRSQQRRDLHERDYSGAEPAITPGTGKSHALIALGHAAVEAGLRVRYFTAAELVESLYRGLADNSVGKVIETLLRNDLIACDEVGFAPLDSTGSQLLFRFVAAAYERRSLAIASHWPFEEWGRFLPDHSTAVSLLDRLLHHNNLLATGGT